MDANSSAVRLVKYCAASCLAVCFILTGCDGDVAFVLPVGDETATATLAPDASTPESLSRRVDEETERNDDNPDAIDATNLDSVASSAGDDSVQESLLESDVKEEEEGEVVDVDKLFSTDPTIDRLKPTKYILVDGEPALLEDGIDLTGKDLSGARINNVTLSHVNFHHAKLNGADLSQARFYRCNFQRVDLADVKAEDTHFLECDFSDAYVGSSLWFGLSHEEFLSTRNYRSKLISDGFYKAQNDDFSNFTFNNAHIKNAWGCNFTDARFIGNCSVAGMTKEQLISTWNYKNKDFTHTKLLLNGEGRGDLSGVDFSGCIFQSLSLGNYDLSEVDFTDAFLQEGLGVGRCVGLTMEQIQSTRNWKARMFNFDFFEQDFDWSNTDFSGFAFVESNIGEGSVEGADFTDAVIGNYAFRVNQTFTVEQIKSTKNFKNRVLDFYLGKTDLDWSGTDFSNFSFSRKFLDGADVTGANFTDAEFEYGGDLNRCKGLTLDQVKSTVNYRSGYPLRLPEELEKRLYEEHFQ